MKLYSKNKKLIKAVLSIVLCISIVGCMTIQLMYCAPFVIPLTSLAPIVGKILITAGVSFISYEALFGASRDCIDEMSQDIADDLRSMAANIQDNAILVKDSVWNHCKSWADSTFNVGSNDYSFQSEGVEWYSGYLASKTDSFYYVVDDVVNECHFVQVESNKAKLMVNGVLSLPNIGADSWMNVVCIMPILSDPPSKYLEFEFCFSVGSAIYTYAAPNNITDILSVRHNYSSVVTGADTIIDNPDYIHGNDVTGENSFLVNQTYADLITLTPEAITDADIITELTTYEGVTCDDVKVEEVPVLSGGVDEGIIQGILDVLTGSISAGISAVSSGINSISQTLENISDLITGGGDGNYSLPFFGFPALLLLLLAILLALLRLFLAVIGFVVSIHGIPADSSLIPEIARQVLDYIRTTELPGFGIPMINILNLLLVVLIGIKVAKTIKANILGVGRDIEGSTKQFGRMFK